MDIKRIKTFVSYLPCVVLLYIFYEIVGCPIKTLTGIPCMGCGMTRAWKSVLTFNFPKAFYYHPLWVIPGIFVFMYLFVKNRNPRAYSLFVKISVILFIVVYIIRLMIHDPVLVVEPYDGLIYRIVSNLR